MHKKRDYAQNTISVSQFEKQFHGQPRDIPSTSSLKTEGFILKVQIQILLFSWCDPSKDRIDEL